MKIALCNEVLKDMPFAAQCEYAARLGYSGLELAPFTLGEMPHRLSDSKKQEIRKIASDNDLEIVGLHWLLVTPQGLSITSLDSKTRASTLEVMKGLVDLCSALGGRVMIHGSPQQRNIAEDDNPGDAWKRARDLFASVAEDAQGAGVTYCLEALTPAETNFINSVAEAAEMVRSVDNPGFQTMIDTKAAASSETRSVPELIHEWLPSGLIRHIHLNDPNRRGPGQGELRLGPILSALAQENYTGLLSVEPFDYYPDPGGCAAFSYGYLSGLQEDLNARHT